MALEFSARTVVMDRGRIVFDGESERLRKDPEFLADVTRSTLSVGLMTGEDLQKLIAQVSNLPADLLEKVRVAYLSNQH